MEWAVFHPEQGDGQRGWTERGRAGHAVSRVGPEVSGPWVEDAVPVCRSSHGALWKGRLRGKGEAHFSEIGNWF